LADKARIKQSVSRGGVPGVAPGAQKTDFGEVSANGPGTAARWRKRLMKAFADYCDGKTKSKSSKKSG
jgi:hypothetical protein